jgi:hypothetical protein
VRGIARTWSKLRLDWEIGLHRLPFFTQKVAVMLLAALVASLALLGGVVTLIGQPGADGPDRLVPGSTGEAPATTRPAPGHGGGRDAGGGQGAGGATAPVGARAPVPADAPASGRGPAGPEAAPGAGGGAPAAPPTTASTTTTTTGQGGLPPLDDVVSSVLSTLLP